MTCSALPSCAECDVEFAPWRPSSPFSARARFCPACDRARRREGIGLAEGYVRRARPTEACVLAATKAFRERNCGGGA